MKFLGNSIILVFVSSLIITSCIAQHLDHCIQCHSQSSQCQKCETPHNVLINDSMCASYLISTCQICDKHNSLSCMVCKQSYIRTQKNNCVKKISTGTFIGIILGSTMGINMLVVTLLRCTHYYKKYIKGGTQKKSIQAITDRRINNRRRQCFQFQIDYDNTRDYCSICLLNQCDLILECNHYLHSQCFGEWVKKSASCPLCKSETNSVKLIECIDCKRRCILINIKQLNETGRIKKNKQCCKIDSSHNQEQIN